MEDITMTADELENVQRELGQLESTAARRSRGASRPRASGAI